MRWKSVVLVLMLLVLSACGGDDASPTETSPPLVTELIEADYQGFNLVHYNGQYYALALSLGEVILTQLDTATLQTYQADGLAYVAPTLEELKAALPVVYDPAIPTLVEENYRGFNIVAFQGQFYALALSLGEVDIAQTSPQTLAVYEAQQTAVVAPTLEEVKAKAFVASLDPEIPELITENYRGFNIVAYNEQFYALSLELGEVDVTEIDDTTLDEYRASGEILIASTYDEIVQQLDIMINPAIPELIEEGYNGFNIVTYQREFYAISLSVGSIDLTQLDEETLNRYVVDRDIFVAPTLEEVKQMIDE